METSQTSIHWSAPSNDPVYNNPYNKAMETTVAVSLSAASMLIGIENWVGSTNVGLIPDENQCGQASDVSR